MTEIGMTGPHHVQTQEEYARWERDYAAKETFYIPSPLYIIQNRLANHLHAARPNWSIESEWDQSGNYLRVNCRATALHATWSQGVEWDEGTRGFWTATLYESEEALYDWDRPLLTHCTFLPEDCPIETLAPVIEAVTVELLNPFRRTRLEVMKGESAEVS